MPRYARFFLYVGVIALLVYLVSLHNEKTDLTKLRAAQGTVFTTGCVIRWDSSGQPYVLENTSHANTANCHDLGISSSGYLVVHHISGAISTVICNTDESLTKQNIICGGSGGGNKTQFWFQDVYNGVQVKANSTRLRCTYCNVWIGFIKVA